MNSYIIILLILICGSLIGSFRPYCYNESFKLYNGEYWNEYRLGDIFRGYFQEPGEEEVKNKYFNNIHKRWPNSLASLYLLETKNKDFKNHQVLAKIIQTKCASPSEKNKNNSLNPGNSIVIHLRLGDIMKTGVRNTYLSTYNDYENIVKTIKNKYPNNKNIVIVTGAHSNIGISNSELFIKKIEKLLKNNGYNIKYRVGKPPDDDMCFLSRSKIFIPSKGGGFTKLASELVKLNNGTVIEI